MASIVNPRLGTRRAAIAVLGRVTTISVTVTDSRGNQATATASVTVG